MEGLAVAFRDIINELKSGPKKDDHGNTLHQAGHRSNDNTPVLSIIGTAVAMNPGFYKTPIPNLVGPTTPAPEIKADLSYRAPSLKPPTLG